MKILGFTIPVIVLLAVAYIVGARMPQLAQKLKLA